MKILEALTYDDVSLVPGYSKILPKSVSLCTEICPQIVLNSPLVSAAMDTVTESKMAIALARRGGIGVIHKNGTMETQAAEIEAVKKSEAAVVTEPIIVGPELPIGEAIGMMRKHGVSGVPVVLDGILVGILTHRDIRFVEVHSGKVADFMTPRERLVTVQEGTSILDAKVLLQKHRIEKLPVVDKEGHLKGLMTIKDIAKSESYPESTKDAWGRLRVAAAVGVGEDLKERARLLAEKDVDIFCVDTAHGHSQGVLDAVTYLKQNYGIPVIAGNIVTAEAAEELFRRGADAVKVGVGPGSICTTRVVSGVGVPQFSAVANCAQVARKYGRHVIADGGIKFSGDMVKALAAGASAVMVGNLLAGCDEAPGDMQYYQGRPYKTYRGMGSLGAMKRGSAERYFQEVNDPEAGLNKLVPEGIEGRIPYRGKVENIVHQLLGGVRSGMGYVGAANIQELWEKAQFVRVTSQGLREAHVHDVSITKEAPNYHVD